MSDFFVEFAVASERAFRRLIAVVAALVEAKSNDDFRDTAHWLAFFDTAERSHFWWPTATEADDFVRRWEAAPVAMRLTDPSFRPPAWGFESVIDAFQSGDYELLG